MPWILIRTFSTRAEAEIAKAFLESNGLLSRLQSDSGGLYPQLDLTRGISLWVDEEDKKDAERLLPDGDDNPF